MLEAEETFAPAPVARIDAPPSGESASDALRTLLADLRESKVSYMISIRKMVNKSREILVDEWFRFEDDSFFRDGKEDEDGSTKPDWTPQEMACKFGLGKFDVIVKWVNPDKTKGMASYWIPLGGPLFEAMHRDYKRTLEYGQPPAPSTAPPPPVAAPQVDAMEMVERVGRVLAGMQQPQVAPKAEKESDSMNAMMVQMMQMQMKQMEIAADERREEAKRAAERSDRMMELMFTHLIGAKQQHQPQDEFAVLDKALGAVSRMVEARAMVTGEKESALDRVIGMAEKFAPAIIAMLAQPREKAVETWNSVKGIAGPEVQEDIRAIQASPRKRELAQERLSAQFGADGAKAILDIIAGKPVPVEAAPAPAAAPAAPAPVVEESIEVEPYKGNPDILWDGVGAFFDKQGNEIDPPEGFDPGGEDDDE